MVKKWTEGAHRSGHKPGTPFSKSDHSPSFTGEPPWENFLGWLRDAHAMEKQAEMMLSTIVNRVEDYPAFQNKLQSHLEETRDQTQMLEICIEKLGSDTSTMKDLIGQFTALAQDIPGTFVDDELLRDFMTSYTFEHMEIISYKILISAATALGEHETAAVCRQILQQEENMAVWLGRHASSVTEQYLLRSVAP